MADQRTWILIADAASARCYLHLGTGPVKSGRLLDAVEDFALDTELPPSRELDSDRPGRNTASAGGIARHAFEPTSDAHREMKRDFARTVADRVAHAFDAHAFDKLVIAAAPKTLGDLRTALPARVRAVVSAEIAKDLVKIPAIELADHFQELRFIG